MNSTKCFMTLRSLAGDESALTLPSPRPISGQALEWARECFDYKSTDDLSFHPRPLAGEGRVRAHSQSGVFDLPSGSLLSGCMVGPDYRRPSVTTPGLFRGLSCPDGSGRAVHW